MAKIEVTPITSGYNVAALNETLQNIEDEFKDKVVYRDEVSPMERALDMNGEDILNANTITADQISLNGVTLTASDFDPDSSSSAALRYDLAQDTGASLVGADDAASGSLFTTVQGFVDRVRSADGAGVVGFQQIGTGAIARTLQDKAREAVSVKDFGAVGDGVTDDTAAIQAAIDSGSARVNLMKGVYLFTNIIIKPSLREFVGVGAASADTYLKRKTGATGAAISWGGVSRNSLCFIGHFRMDGNSEAGETYGLDLSGFSYSTFENIWVRLFRLDGIYADGSITPVDKQYSNNTFINVRSNNNLRDGWRFDGSSQANSANTYIGCEGAGNAGRGFNELVGYSNQCVGCTFQGNKGRDFYTNGSRSKHDFYAEGDPKPVELGSASFGNHFSVRSSYPLWNTFVDSGVQNIVSVRGEVEPEKQIFDNPYILNWLGLLPANIARNGTPTLVSYVDTDSPSGAGVQVTVNANFQGLIFTLSETNTNLQDKWVTLILEVDTSGVVDTLNNRVYTRDGTTLNLRLGEFATETLPVSASGTYLTLAYDVKFNVTVSGTPTVLWYIAYSGLSGSNVVKIRSAQILMGQTRNSSEFLGIETQHSADTGILSAAANGINTHRKYAGRLAYETSTGKMRYAIGITPTSAWRATDGSGDLTPT